jgi:hypothetical protein
VCLAAQLPHKYIVAYILRKRKHHFCDNEEKLYKMGNRNIQHQNAMTGSFRPNGL